LWDEEYEGTANTRYFGHTGTPKYDGLQTRAEKRFSNGLGIMINYTWSHTRNFDSNDSGSGIRVNHPDYWQKNYGSADYDYRHVFNTTGVWELPFGPGRQRLTEGAGAAILGGWQLNWTARMSTGNYQTITASGSSLNASGSGQYADCLGPIEVIGSRTEWWSSANLADPNDDPVNPHRFGTCGSQIAQRPGLVNFDLGLFRKFELSERMDLQFRAEGFNISNTPHFSGPNGDIGSSNFGIIGGVQNTGREGLDQRVFRLGLRLGF
jgi:hypothetical protein